MNKKIYKKKFGEELSDEEAREIGDNLYQLVEIVLDEYLRERVNKDK